MEVDGSNRKYGTFSGNGAEDVTITTGSLLGQLDKFLSLATSYGASDRRGGSHSGRGAGERSSVKEEDEQLGTKTALYLLRNLPPARPAALCFLAKVLSRQVAAHIHGNKTAGSDEGLVCELETLLGELVEATPTVWGPLVASWAVEQLEQWSVEWGSSIIGHADAILEELVATWLACGPVRTLAGLTVACVKHDPDTTVAALLEASSNSGPSLDWLVAHVGCSFPATVIGRVLSLGLRRYATPSQPGRVVLKLTSVNVILDHLADRHLPDIHRALHGILRLTFSSTNTDNQTKAAVPFLLQLASTSRSKAVLSALTSALPALLEPNDHLITLASRLNWWVPQYFPTATHLLDLVVHLLLDTGGGAASKLLWLLLRGTVASSQLPQPVTSAMSVILNTLLGELSSLTYMRRSTGSAKPHVPLLADLAGGREGSTYKNRMLLNGACGLPVEEMIDWALQHDNLGEVVVRRLGQILTVLIVQQGPSTSTSLLVHLLHHRYKFLNPSHLQLLIVVIKSIVHQPAAAYQRVSVLPSALMTSLHITGQKSTMLSGLQSLEMLVRGCKQHNSHIAASLTSGLLLCLPRLSHVIGLPELGSSVMLLIGQLPLDRPLPLGIMQSLAQATVFYFLSSLQEETLEKKVSVAAQCDRVLLHLARSSLGHGLIIRLLVTAVFRLEWSYLFGAKSQAFLDVKEVPEELLQANKQFDSWVKFPQSHTSIFHAGVIEKGSLSRVTCNVAKAPLSKESVALHTQLLINLMGTCCRSQGLSEGVTTIALLLVELISPDIMFNGFPWPEENIKFTFERDLAIKKTFDEFPIAWHLLEVVARSRPALCYCSVLVRALTAALMAHWNTCPFPYAHQNPKLLAATRRLLEVMVVGQFLPESLYVLPQMVDCLAPHEVVCVLQDVWTYLRDNTPSPDRWVLLPSGAHHRPSETPDPCYTERCRQLIQLHVDTLGHLLPAMLAPHS